MCPVDALRKWQLQHLVSQCYRFIQHMHIQFTRLISKRFKFQELKLNVKRSVLHFKCAYDFFVRDKLMDNPVETMLVSFRVGGYKLVAAVFFIFQFHYFGSHPLLHNFSLFMGLKQ